MIIWKFNIPAFEYGAIINDVFIIKMPSFSEILSVGEQEGKLVLWAAVNKHNPVVPMKFRVIGTGFQEMPSTNRRFIGTVQRISFDLIAHVFQELE